MQYDLYILVYFDGGHPKFFCLALPLLGIAKYFFFKEGIANN
jgi:hypothetical protein